MLTFYVHTGDWVFPSNYLGVMTPSYPVDHSLVASIFEKKPKDTVSNNPCIGKHLTGPDLIELTVNNDCKLTIVRILNPLNGKTVKDIDFSLYFTPKKLSRSEQIWLNEGVYHSNQNVECQLLFDKVLVESMFYQILTSIFFSGVLLQIYLKGGSLPEGITFRKASEAEVEGIKKNWAL